MSRQDFWKLIYDLTREGITIFVTTHYLDEAEHANRIGMITDGILRAVAPPAELKRTLHGQLLNVICDAPFDAIAILEEIARHTQRDASGQRRSRPGRPNRADGGTDHPPAAPGRNHSARCAAALSQPWRMSSSA